MEELLRETKMNVPIDEVVIYNDEEAARYHFSGSPHVMVDGKDIDSMADRIKNFHASGCRMYFWKDKVYEGPPREMVKEALGKIK